MHTLYLASSSPRRQAILKQIGIPFSTVIANINEMPQTDESPADYVLRLAIAKAKAGFNKLTEQQQTDACILGADTTVSINDNILGKPCTQQQAVTMLGQLSNKIHQVYTAIALYYDNKLTTHITITHVTMRMITEHEIITYWQTEEPKDKAGGYAIQGLGAIFIEQIKGDYYGVVGLPIAPTVQLLQNAGIQSSIIKA